MTKSKLREALIEIDNLRRASLAPAEEKEGLPSVEQWGKLQNYVLGLKER